MCTFGNERTVRVCDAAIGPVRARLDHQFGDSVSYIHRDGEPTRVVAAGNVPAVEFKAAAEAAITTAQTLNQNE